MEKRHVLVGLMVIIISAGSFLVLQKNKSQSIAPITGGGEIFSSIQEESTNCYDTVHTPPERAMVSPADAPPVLAPTVDPAPTLLSTNELARLLPDWMDYEGVDLHTETVVIAGHSVNRARGRFEWPNGSSMEMEVSDVGEAPGTDLLKSLGFNVEAEPPQPEMRISLPDFEHTVLLQEYNPDAFEGFVQLLIKNRFLVEIQLENLPPESFGTVIDFQIPLEALIQAADASVP